MALTYEFYIARAEEAAKEAERAQLDNVRERALRSEAAWRDMADKARKIVIDREQAQREKELRQAEAALAETEIAASRFV
ncbi:hypothetical protein [Altererythrobacter fulvus]|uniref:hypothetical protein n=1 Tax=Caenibius fulvus TaxID=2126012 RepID=UPI003015F1FA